MRGAAEHPGPLGVCAIGQHDLVLDPRRLSALRAVSAHGSIAAAATALGYTASAVSQSVAAMERYLDLQLMERTPRGVTLTPAGLRLVEHADVILAHLDAAEDEARAFKGGDAGRVWVGTLPSAAALVARAAGELLRARPGTELRIVEIDPVGGLAGLRAGALDVTLVPRYAGIEHERPGWLEDTPLLEEPLLAVLPDTHRLADRGPVRLADLAAERFITEPEPEHRSLTHVACRAAGFTPEVAAGSSDYDVTLALVAGGLGVALVPRLAVRELPGIAARPLADPAVTRRLLAATRVGTGRVPAVASMLGALLRAARDPVAEPPALP